MAVYPGPWLDGSFYGLTVVEFERSSVETLGARVSAIPVLHTENSIAFRVESAERVFCYSGDTDVCEGLVAAARNADLFLCEASFPDEARIPGHLTPSLAAQMAQRSKARKLVLTHFYPVMEGVDIKASCSSHFQSDVVVGEDLLRIEV
jgi:ribonuclease BN (tRNA processing enzyme)